MAKSTKDKTKPKPEETKKANPNHLSYQGGNGEYLVVQLLTLLCNKLDEMRNHTSTLVMQNDEIIKLLKENQI
jgi:hypothetical protein